MLNESFVRHANEQMEIERISIEISAWFRISLAFYAAWNRLFWLYQQSKNKRSQNTFELGRVDGLFIGTAFMANYSRSLNSLIWLEILSPALIFSRCNKFSEWIYADLRIKSYRTSIVQLTEHTVDVYDVSISLAYASFAKVLLMIVLCIIRCTECLDLLYFFCASLSWSVSVSIVCSARNSPSVRKQVRHSSAIITTWNANAFQRQLIANVVTLYGIICNRVTIHCF